MSHEIEITSLSHMVPVMVSYKDKMNFESKLVVYVDYNEGDIVFPELDALDEDFAKELRNTIVDALTGRINSGYYDVPEDEIEEEEDLETMAEIYTEDIEEIDDTKEDLMHEHIGMQQEFEEECALEHEESKLEEQMAEQINLNVGAANFGRNEKNSLSKESAYVYDAPSYFGTRPITWKTLTAWLDMQTLDEYTKKEVMKTVSRYPTNALHNFVKNFDKHLMRIQKQKKELYREKSDKKSESVLEERTDPGSNTQTD